MFHYIATTDMLIQTIHIMFFAFKLKLLMLLKLYIYYIQISQ